MTATPALLDLADYGAVGDGVTDCLPAWQAALKAVRARPRPPGNVDGFMGCTFRFPWGVCRLSGPLDVDLGSVVEGAGNGGWFAGTQLLFDPGVPGVRIHDSTTSPDQGYGSWSVIRDLALVGQGGAVAHGVQMFARGFVENVYIRGFSGDGVHIDSSPTATPSGVLLNANNWGLRQVQVQLCGGHGVYTFGISSNAGRADLVDCSNNGGWGFCEKSFLGNTYIACHASFNGIGPYYADGPVAHSVFDGCYAEQGPPNSQIGAPAFVLGGILGGGVIESPPGRPLAAVLSPGADGLRLYGGPLHCVMDAGNGVQIHGRFGTPGGSTPLPFAWGSSDDPYGELAYRLQYAQAYKRWDVTYGGSRPLIEYTPDYVGFPVGYRLGQGTAGRRVIPGDGPPTAGAWVAGDRVEALHPVAGGWLGWVCIRSGDFATTSPPIWKTYGPISA